MPMENQCTLGRTELKVGRLGISARFDFNAGEIEALLERGQNLFHCGSVKPAWESAFRHGGAGRLREHLVFALQTYSRSSLLLRLALERRLRRSRIGYLDILILGYWNQWPPPRIIEAAQKLKQRGLVRFIGVSTHNQALIQSLAKERFADVVMLRYNAAHRGAEQDLSELNCIEPSQRPGTIGFTATHWRHLTDPRKTPPGEKTPNPGDCYRFVLSQPGIDVTLCGAADREQLNHAVESLKRGPLSAEEMLWMRRVGDSIAAEKRSMLYERF